MQTTPAGDAVHGVAGEIERRLYRTMLTIRLFETRISREFRTGEIPGFVHSYVGQEAVAAGVCANLRDDDWITSTHRGHGHSIAKGCSLAGMMAEIYGRETGLCKGRGGSMHIADFRRGMLGANAIVGGGIALATGAGLSARVRGTDQVAVAFFGDGASNQGVLHESMNLAAIWQLPVLFVCENNGFAESTPALYATSVPDIATRAAGYGMSGEIVDASDALAVHDAARRAVAGARGGGGPILLELKTHRFMGHFEGDPDRYRDDDERSALRTHDALEALRVHVLAHGLASDGDLSAIQAEIEAEIDAAVEFARASPLPDPADVERYVHPGEGAPRHG
jgi:pyruvate dehydrogenase E1 component alpha subunit